MPKAKPWKGWGTPPPETDNPYTTDQETAIISAIENERATPLSNDQRVECLDKIKISTAALLRSRYRYKQGPTPGQVKAGLTELENTAMKLRDAEMAFDSALHNLDPASLAAIRQVHGRETLAAHQLATCPKDGPEAIRGRLEQLQQISDEACSAIRYFNEKTQKSREEEPITLFEYVLAVSDDGSANEPLRKPKDSALDRYIQELALVFEEYTGKEPKCYVDRISEKYTGNFLPFVNTCLAPIDDQPNRKALGKTVQNAMKKRKGT